MSTNAPLSARRLRRAAARPAGHAPKSQPQEAGTLPPREVRVLMLTPKGDLKVVYK